MKGRVSGKLEISNVRLPEIGNRQGLVLSFLAEGGELSGRALRDRLFEIEKETRSGAAFYQLMARLEDTELVEGFYAEVELPTASGKTRRGPIPEKNYRITAAGQLALDELREFCLKLLGQRGLALDAGNLGEKTDVR